MHNIYWFMAQLQRKANMASRTTTINANNNNIMTMIIIVIILKINLGVLYCWKDRSKPQNSKTPKENVAFCGYLKVTAVNLTTTETDSVWT